MVQSARENIKLKKNIYCFNFIMLRLGFVCLLLLELHWLTSLQNSALLADIQSHAASEKQWLDRWEEQIIMLQFKKKKII
jgi:hypothetical protein